MRSCGSQAEWIELGGRVFGARVKGVDFGIGVDFFQYRLVERWKL